MLILIHVPISLRMVHTDSHKPFAEEKHMAFSPIIYIYSPSSHPNEHHTYRDVIIIMIFYVHYINIYIFVYAYLHMYAMYLFLSFFFFF